MKSLIAHMTKKRNEKVKAEAVETKKLDGKQKNVIKKEQVKHIESTEPTVMKEPKTLMLD